MVERWLAKSRDIGWVVWEFVVFGLFIMGVLVFLFGVTQGG